MNDSDEDHHAGRRKASLEIARNRPATNAAKSILAYHDEPDLPKLVNMFEEISKNTDFSTDLRLSLLYYLDELLLQCAETKRFKSSSILISASSVLEYCGKIYSDRVEYMHQVVQNQIESLLLHEPRKDQVEGESTGAKAAEPRKRRVKKLIKADVDPFMLTLEPRKLKTMSSEKRFSNVGFVKCNRNRTIEYLYHDHTPQKVWNHACILDPCNPNERDEKKFYKLFTYHVEHRYNTLVNDISFERMNWVKEYVHAHQINIRNSLNEHMTSSDYLQKYIALENCVLEDRYNGNTSYSAQKRKEFLTAESSSKRLCVDTTEEDADATCTTPTRFSLNEAVNIDSGIDSMLADECTLNSTLNSSGNRCSQSLTTTLEQSTLTAEISADSALGDSLGIDKTINNTLNERSGTTQSNVSADASLGRSLQFNESSIADSTQMESVDKLASDECDPGIELDEGIDGPTDQKFDDEGVVLSDIEDIRLLSPKVLVQDILPGVPNKENLTVNVDTEMLALMGVNDVPILEETLKVPTKKQYEIVKNILGISHKRLRAESIFKLTKDFKIFMEARKQKRGDVHSRTRSSTKTVAIVNSPDISSKRIAGTDDQRVSYKMELTKDGDLLGFDCPELSNKAVRRYTHDSGIDQGNSQLFDQQAANDAAIELAFELDSSKNKSKKARSSLNNTSNEDVAANLQTNLDADENGNSPDEDVEASTAANDGDFVLDGRHAETSSIDGNTSTGKTNKAESSEKTICEIDSEGQVIIADTAGDSTSANNVEPSAVHSPVENDDENEIFDDAISQHSRQGTPLTQAAYDETLVENEFEGLSDSSAMVRDWHIRLAPKLKCAYERESTDIKSRKAEIIDLCQTHNGNLTLENVMAGKDRVTMCSYMLASLMLTNEGNVTLNFGTNKKDRPLHMSEFNMTLVSTKLKTVNPDGVIVDENPAQESASRTAIKKAATKRKNVQESHINLKTVCLVEPVPKHTKISEDNDSGISTLSSLKQSSPSLISR